MLTEDSDLLLFGASRCFFKMDLKGNGIEIDLKNLPHCDLFKAFSPSTKTNHDTLSSFAQDF